MLNHLVGFQVHSGGPFLQSSFLKTMSSPVETQEDDQEEHTYDDSNVVVSW